MAHLSVIYNGRTINENGMVSPSLISKGFHFTWLSSNHGWYALSFIRVPADELYLLRINMTHNENGVDIIPMRLPDIVGTYVAQLYQQKDYIFPEDDNDQSLSSLTLIASVNVPVTYPDIRMRATQPVNPTREEEINLNLSEEEDSPSDRDGTEMYEDRWSDRSIDSSGEEQESIPRNYHTFDDTKLIAYARTLHIPIPSPFSRETLIRKIDRKEYNESRSSNTVETETSDQRNYCRCLIQNTGKLGIKSPSLFCAQQITTQLPTTCGPFIKEIATDNVIQITDDHLKKYARGHGYTIPRPYNREQLISIISDEPQDIFQVGSVGEKAYCKCVIDKVASGTLDNAYTLCRKEVGHTSRRCGDITNWNEIDDNELMAYAKSRNVRIPSPFDREVLIASIRTKQ